MRRQEIIHSVSQVVNAIDKSGILEQLSKPLGPRSREPGVSVPLLVALKSYAIAAEDFDSEAREVVDIFNLELLEDPTFWVHLMESGESPVVDGVRSSLVFARRFLPKLLFLITQESLRDIQSAPAGSSRFKNLKTIEVRVFEAPNTFSTPARLAHVLESMENFYTACALLENESPSNLSVVALDSGSDKSFDFLGAAKVMEAIERVIIELWDRVFFFRERQFEERLDLITKSLPIVELINKMEEQKQLQPELAEIIRRNVIEGSNKFIQSGATIPQMEDSTHYDPRKLLAPAQKLLVAGPPVEDQEGAVSKPDDGDTNGKPIVDEPDPFENLTPEERAQMRNLLGKVRGSSSDKEETNDSNGE